MRSRGVGIVVVAGVLGMWGVGHGHSVMVDGLVTEWSTRVAPISNLGMVCRAPGGAGEFIWTDATGDARIDLSNPENAADLTALQITGTATRLYILARFAANIGTSVQLQIAIDTNQTFSGQPMLDGFADTDVHPNARWEYLIKTRFPTGEAPVLELPNFTVSSVLASSLSASGTELEIAVLWSSLGFGGPPQTPLRFTVATFRATSIHATQEIGNSTVSDVLDAVTNYGTPGTAANTFAEVSDQILDYHFDVYFSSQGDVIAPVLIERVLYQGTDAANEWITLRNVIIDPIDLSQYKIGDEEGIVGGEQVSRFPAGLTIAPSARREIARDGAAYLATTGLAPDAEFVAGTAAPEMIATGWTSGAFNLGDTGDEVLLFDARDTLVDVATYGTGSFAGVTPHLVVSAGQVLARLSFFPDTDDCVSDFLSAWPPVLGSIGSGTVVEGSTLTFTVSATDLNGDPLIYSAANLPAGATLNSATGQFSWTPPPGGAAGSPYTVTFTVTDLTTLTDSEVISITVSAPGGGGGGSDGGCGLLGLEGALIAAWCGLRRRRGWRES